MHARAIRVENTGNLDLETVLAMIVEKKGLGAPFTLVIAGRVANKVHVSTIGFRLGVNAGIAVYFRSRGLEDFGICPFRQSPSMLMEPCTFTLVVCTGLCW